VSPAWPRDLLPQHSERAPSYALDTSCLDTPLPPRQPLCTQAAMLPRTGGHYVREQIYATMA